MNAIVPTPDRAQVIEAVIARGDLGKLNAEERTRYYVQLCNSMGLNPHTQPFAFLTLNGKLTLYAKRDAADQLRKINGISIEIVEKSFDDGLFTVHVRAKDRDGRSDEDYGVVALPDTLKGEARANQLLKCITKAKRRVTLSISGLGFLDEIEVDDIPRQTARARNAAIAELPEEERHEASERAHDEWSDKQAASLSNSMRANPTTHDVDGVVVEEEPAGDTVIWNDTEMQSKEAFLYVTRDHIRTATDAAALHAWWNSEEQKELRRDFGLTDRELKPLKDFITGRIAALKQNSGTGK